MRAKTCLLISLLTACVVAGCSTKGNGSITFASGNGVTVSCGTGGIILGNGSLSISGLKAETSDGRKIKHILIILFIDRNGDGIPDPTEILDQDELTSLEGETLWICGLLQGSWGGNDPQPKMHIEVELNDGTVWRVTKSSPQAGLEMQAPMEQLFDLDQ